MGIWWYFIFFSKGPESENTWIPRTLTKLLYKNSVNIFIIIFVEGPSQLLLMIEILLELFWV